MGERGRKRCAGLVLLAWGLAGACGSGSGETGPGDGTSTGTDTSTSTGMPSTSEGSTSAADTTSATMPGESSTGETSTGDPPSDPDYGQAGPHPVGHVRIEIDDASGMRVLPVEIWYPADAAEAAAAEAGVPLGEAHDGHADAAVFWRERGSSNADQTLSSSTRSHCGSISEVAASSTSATPTTPVSRPGSGTERYSPPRVALGDASGTHVEVR